MLLNADRRNLATSLLLLTTVLCIPDAAFAQADPEMPYATEEVCSTVLEELIAGEDVVEAALNFATDICYASRLVDFRARQDASGGGKTADNGSTRSLPKPSDPVPERASVVDGQIAEATERSRESYDALAQGDPKAAYDLLRRLIGDQGSGS